MSDDTLAGWAEEMGVPLEELKGWKADDWQRHLDQVNAHAVVESAATDLVAALIAEHDGAP